VVEQQRPAPNSVVRLECLAEEYFIRKITGATPADAILTAISIVYVRKNYTRLTAISLPSQLNMDANQANQAYGLIDILLQQTTATNLMIFFRYLQTHLVRPRACIEPDGKSPKPLISLRQQLKTEIALLRQERLISSE